MTEPRTTPLAEFLSTRDATCERCGFNLRGLTGPFCPECGGVVPRPQTHLLEQAAGKRIVHLWCRACGYDLSKSPAERCPECGAPATTPVAAESPERAPYMMLIAAAGGVLMLVLTAVTIAMGMRRSITVWTLRSPIGLLIGAALTLVPIAVLAWWVRALRRGTLGATPSERRMARTILSWLSFAAAAAGVGVLIRSW